MQLIIGTQFSAVGGHSRVAYNFTHLAADNIVVVTDAINDQTDAARQEMLDFFHPVPVLFLPRGNMAFKLDFLINLIKRLKPTYVSCFNHHVDPLPVAATSAAPVPRKIFYHHCDSMPSLGASLSHYSHFDTSSAVADICNKRDSATRASLMTLYDSSLADTAARPPRAPQRPLNTLSAGGANKYLFSYEPSQLSYAHVLPHLLTASGGVHHHFGTLGDDHREVIAALLRHSGVEPERFIYHGNVASLQQAALAIENPVYVPSFPVSGGLTLVEMMSVGVPILVNDAPRDTDAYDVTKLAHQSMLPKHHVAWRHAGMLAECLAELRANYAGYAESSHQQFLTQHTRHQMLADLAALRVPRAPAPAAGAA